jgi:inosine/xanthosine triphosphate pyrophosphatase family protein
VSNFVLATANPDKAAEIRAILGPTVALVARPPDVPDVDETGETLTDNAASRSTPSAGRRVSAPPGTPVGTRRTPTT